MENIIVNFHCQQVSKKTLLCFMKQMFRHYDLIKIYILFTK